MKKIDARIVLTILLSVSLSLFGVSCSGIMSGDDAIAPQTLSISQQYDNAVLDSMLKSDIYSKLTAIYSTNENLVWNDARTHIAVLNIMKPGRESTYSPAGKELTIQWKAFVTVVPELSNRIKSAPYANLNLRVEQALGLPDTGYDYAVELWARPADLFRPTPDPEIDDTIASLTFPTGVSTDHVNWFNQHVVESYYSAFKYPFTRLGYTYDWSGGSKYGPSEFVIRTGSVVSIKKPAGRLAEYFK